MSLSVCMIVKDEAATLRRALECAFSVADEVIVVDTGSKDGSADIARSMGAKVYSYEWQNDFSAARNYSFSLASCEYAMWLDADDVICEKDTGEIRAIAERGGFDVAMLRYISGPLLYYRERIVRCGAGLVWQGVVHEAIVPRGKIIYSAAAVLHKKVKPADPMRNLNIYQYHIARGLCLDERQKFYYGRELYYNNMPRQAAAVLSDFMRGGGWNINKAEACRILYFCHKLAGERAVALDWLVRSFLYVTPRARDCCLLADEFFASRNYECARFWYLQAMNSRERAEEGGFVDRAFFTRIPANGMAAVCGALGDVEGRDRWLRAAKGAEHADESG